MRQTRHTQYRDTNTRRDSLHDAAPFSMGVSEHPCVDTLRTTPFFQSYFRETQPVGAFQLILPLLAATPPGSTPAGCSQQSVGALPPELPVRRIR